MKLVDLGGNETMRVYCKYCKHNKWVQESNNEHRYSYYNGLESNSEYYKAICTHLNYRKVTHNPFDASGKPGNCFDINKNNDCKQSLGSLLSMFLRLSSASLTSSVTGWILSSKYRKGDHTCQQVLALTT